jgi:hypothetical protein
MYLAILETTMRLYSSFLAAFLLLTPPATFASDSSSHKAYEQLKGLAGTWKSTNPKNPTSIEVVLIANGSALVETWTMSPTRKSMTVYTLDGDRLLATHYCPQGNAPRLTFTNTDDTGAHHFTFLDGTNLQNQESSHAHALIIRAEPNGNITRTETYISNGSNYDPAKDIGDTETFTRAK